MSEPISRTMLDFYQRELGTISIAMRVIAWLAAGAMIGLGFILAQRSGNVDWLLGAVAVSAVVSAVLHLAAAGVFAIHSELRFRLNAPDADQSAE